MKVGRTSESICKAPSYPCHTFSTKVDSQNARFGIHSQQRKWDVVLQGDIVIAAEVFYNLHWMYKEDGRSSWHHLVPPYGSYHVISVEADPQFAHKMPDLG